MRVWVCRAGKKSVYYERFLREERIYLTWGGWKENFTLLPKDTMLLRSKVQRECNDTTKTAVSNHLSQIVIFYDKMQIGDWVLVPGENSRQYSIGVIDGDYYYDPCAGEHFYHQRKVKWKMHNVKREEFSKSMQYSLGAFRTVFSLNDTKEFSEFCCRNDLKGCE